MNSLSRQTILPPPLPTHVALYAQLVALSFRAAFGAKKVVERVLRALQAPRHSESRPALLPEIEPLEASLPLVKQFQPSRPAPPTVPLRVDTPTVRLGPRRIPAT